MYWPAKVFIAFCIFSSGLYANNSAPDCHPQINPSQKQFIVGFGSLISESSKKMSVNNAGDNIPVIIMGYQRGWFLKGSYTKFGATFLGIKAKENSKMNGVVFNMPDVQGLLTIDERERYYCRQLIGLSALQSLTTTQLPIAQYWIYVPKPSNIALPSAQYPIVQSYVDVFLSGCLQIEKKFHLHNYARQCIQTTSDWPKKHWINDRVYPRRPMAMMPEALVIDKLLSEEEPKAFKSVILEGQMQ